MSESQFLSGILSNTTKPQEQADDDTLVETVAGVLILGVGAYLVYSALRMCRIGEMVLVPRRYFQVGADSMRTTRNYLQSMCYGNWLYMALAASEDYLLQEVCQ